MAQKLQKAGWKGDTQYLWSEHTAPTSLWSEEAYDRQHTKECDKFSTYQAPTATQLAEELPDRLELANRFTIALQILKFKNKWIVGYWVVENNSWQFAKEAKTFPDALGLMMEYLLINKMI